MSSHYLVIVFIVFALEGTRSVVSASNCKWAGMTAFCKALCDQNNDAGLTDTMAEYRDAFSLFDHKGDGKISVSQIGDILRALGLNPTNAELHKLSDCGSYKPYHRISFQEFLPVFYHFKLNDRDQTNMEDFIEGLKVFDKEGNGFINSSELRHVLASLSESLTEEQVDELLKAQNQGGINYAEFIKLVMKG